MAFKPIFTLLLVGSFHLVLSQTKMIEFTNTLKTTGSNTKIKDVIPIVNDISNELALFLADPKNVCGYTFDSEFQITEKLAFPAKKRKYKTLIGNSISENQDYRVFLTNKKKTSFLTVNFSFKEGATTSKEFKLQSHGEKFIQTISLDNKFYLISVDKIKKALFIYSFDDDGLYERHHITVTNLFRHKSNSLVPVTQLLTANNKSINKIDSNIPNSIEVTAEKVKMYILDNSLVFTFDNHSAVTQLLTIDLSTYISNIEIVDAPKHEFSTTRFKSNSFITKDYLFLAATTRDKLVFRVHNYKTKELFKEYVILRDEPISFKNSPIIQEGGVYTSVRKMEKTQKFLRKINSDNFGISVRPVNGLYHATIGGYSIQKGGAGMMMGGFGGLPIASFGNVSVFFNPSMFAYNAMSSTKSTRIECLFDETVNHVEGEIKDNAFDKIERYERKNGEGKTIFRYKDYFIAGRYNPFTKVYSLYKYKD